jgi:RNA recognition motif-containing protein
MGKRLYVGNLPYDTDEAKLREAFAQNGRVVERVHVVLDRETQRPRGFAFVDLATDEQAKQAMAELDGSMLGTRQLRVTEAEDRRGPGGPGGPGGPRPMAGSGPGPGRDRPPFGSSPGRPPSAGPGASFPPGNRFGPDSRPKHERQDAKKAPRRRTGGGGVGGGSGGGSGGEGGVEDYGGRRGSRRFDDDDE